MILGLRLDPVHQQTPVADTRNFWLDLVSAIRPKLDEVVIASIGRESVVNNACISVEFAPLGTRPEKLENDYFLRAIGFAAIFPWLETILRKHDIDVVHLVDNFGPAQVALSQIKVAKSIFQHHYDPRRPIYCALLKLSLQPFDAVVVSSSSLVQNFREMQIATRTISIPLAVQRNCPCERDRQLDGGGSRASLGLMPDSKIILWSGFISTVVSSREFLLSLQVAKRLVKEQSDIEFVFAFKRSLKEEYARYESERIKIIPFRSRSEFHEILRISSLLFSPCLNERAIIGAPLTWLESMAHGVPVVTTNIRGVDELISDGENGIILTQAKQAPEELCRLVRDDARIRSLAAKAREAVEERFEIGKTADAYVSLWTSLTGK